MQTLRILSLSVFLLTVSISSEIKAQVPPETNQFPETPVKTVFIKHPAANDPATFFSTSTMYRLDIYKPGDIAKIVSLIKKDKDVESCTPSAVTGDYQQVDLVLKSTQDKMWFASLFKKAGLNTIKINTNPIVDIEKM